MLQYRLQCCEGNGAARSQGGTTMYRAIVVDDNLSNLELIETLMLRMGFEVYTANSGRGLLQLARQHQPDVILTDLAMPHAEINGLDAIKIIRQDPDLKDIPVVAISAVTGMLEEAHDNRKFEAVLRKPFQIDQLQAIMGKLFGQSFT